MSRRRSEWPEPLSHQTNNATIIIMLECVTFTGADHSVDPQDPIDLSKEYPQVEWGILFSKRHQGMKRFPSIAWLDSLMELAPIGMKLSGASGRETS
jgi:hypothetical protein